MDSDREPILRWLPPIPAAIDGGEMPAVVDAVVDKDRISELT